MLSVIGLALDFVGAIALVCGLFAYSQPLTPGWTRTPEQYAHDGAFGIVGVLFLGAGFAFQSLTYLGVRAHCTHAQIATAAVAALAAGALLAYALYGLLFVALFGYDLRRARRFWAARGQPDTPPYTSPWRRARRDVRWWRQELGE